VSSTLLVPESTGGTIKYQPTKASAAACQSFIAYCSFRRGSSLAMQIVKPLETCRAFSHSSLVSKLLKMYQRDSGAFF
jgi:hypothetical protein